MAVLQTVLQTGQPVAVLQTGPANRPANLQTLSPANPQKVGKETVEYLEKENLIKVTVPIKIIRRGGKSTIETPDGPVQQHDMSQLQHALIQGHRWIKLLENGRYKSVRLLADKEKVDKARISKCIRLTCLAPDIQEAILCETGEWVLTIEACLKPFPMLWTEQREHFKKLAIKFPENG